MKRRGIAPRCIGQATAFHLDYGEISQWISTNQLCRKDLSVGHGDPNISGAVDNVIVSHNVTIGRDDHAAANAVLKLLLRTRSPSEAERPEELLHVVGNLHLRVISLGLRSHRHV